MGQLLRDYGPAIAWAFVVIGWLVNNRQANARERRKEVRADIVEITKDLEKTLDLIRQALLEKDDVPHEVLYFSITTTLSSADQKLERLVVNREFSPRCGVHRTACRDRFEKFYDVATGDGVSVVRSDLEERHKTLFDAHNLANAFVHELNLLFLAEFEP